jgi:fumarate hydratase, class I
MNAPSAFPDQQKPVPPYKHTPLFPLGPDTTPYKKIMTEGVGVENVLGRDMLVVSREALRALSEAAFGDINHYLRPGHLKQLRSILDDKEASDNDKFVAFDFLKNANIAAGGVLPMCQDTGTAIVMGKKGQAVWTGGGDEAAIARGVYKTYTETNLRYSQVSPISMFKEVQTGTNLPAQIDIYATDGDAYKFLFVAKGGGSANKSYLHQQTPAVLNEAALLKFLDTQIRTLGTAACPPYHLAIVVGGTSAEMNLKTVKLASTRYLDDLPSEGNDKGVAIRDREMEKKVLELTRQMGIGAQFGGKYFCHDVRVIRIARHGASVPIGIGVSCSADRQALGKITRDGIFLEQLETNPAHYLPDVEPQQLSGDVVSVDLDKGMAHTLSILTRHPVKTRVNLTGTLIVARDSAHAKLKERLDRGEGLPDYFKQFPVYYAGPAKTPQGMPSGSFGPTTAGRMDSYVDLFQANGGSMVMLAKGNRSKQVVDACKKHKGFYLGSIGGPAAILAKNCIRKVEVLEYPELGMEAIWRIQVENFPAFIVTDDKGNDFFSDLKLYTKETPAGCPAGVGCCPATIDPIPRRPIAAP